MKHIHADLMLEYAKDASETDKPWERWEWKWGIGGEFITCRDSDDVDWDEPEINIRRIDPYRELREAQERGALQVCDNPIYIGGLAMLPKIPAWVDRSKDCHMYWNMSPKCYRIKPEEKSHLNFENANFSKDGKSILLRLNSNGKPIVFIAKDATDISVFDIEITDDDHDYIAREPGARVGVVAHFGQDTHWSFNPKCKVKKTVKKWKWVMCIRPDNYFVSKGYYATEYEADLASDESKTVVQRIDSTMIEVEE